MQEGVLSYAFVGFVRPIEQQQTDEEQGHQGRGLVDDKEYIGLHIAQFQDRDVVDSVFRPYGDVHTPQQAIQQQVEDRAVDVDRRIAPKVILQTGTAERLRG